MNFPGLFCVVKGGGAVEGGLLFHWVWYVLRSDNSKYYVNLGPLIPAGLICHGTEDASYSWWLRSSSCPIVQGHKKTFKTWYPAGLLS